MSDLPNIQNHVIGVNYDDDEHLNSPHHLIHGNDANNLIFLSFENKKEKYLHFDNVMLTTMILLQQQSRWVLPNRPRSKGCQQLCSVIERLR